MPYFQTKIFHKPLVSQEVARHVSVSIVDQHPEACRQQLQIRILHGWIQGGVVIAHVITANQSQGGATGQSKVVHKSAVTHVRTSYSNTLLCTVLHEPGIDLTAFR